MSWVRRPNTEDQINRKPEDQENDFWTENSKSRKMNSTVLNIIFNLIFI